MTVKMVDFIQETTHDVEFGTCELCFSTGDLTEEFFVFEAEDGERVRISTGEWNWGDFDVVYHIDNVVHFGDYINKLKIKSLDELERNFDNIYQNYKDQHNL